MSASPPVLTKGAISGVTNTTCRLSDKSRRSLRKRLRLARAPGAFQLPCLMPRRLGQHFLRPASVERLLRVIAPAPGRRVPRDRPRDGRSHPAARRALRARRRGGDRRGSRASGCARRAPPNVEIVAADALAADLRALVPEGSRLAGNLPYYVSSPLLRRFLSPARPRPRPARHAAGRGGPARRFPAGLEGVRDPLRPLRALGRHRPSPARFPPGCLLSAARRSRSAVLRARFRDDPASRCGGPRRVSSDSSRRPSPAAARTLENNLKDSYPNLKEYLRFLNVEGSRRAETLSVVEFAAIWRALRSDPTGARA